MDQLIIDECTLETELKSYEDQLELVEQQLNVSGQESDEGLLQLQADLSELIGLTQDNLAEVKKRKLLLAIEGSNFSESQDDTNSTEDSQDTANDSNEDSSTITATIIASNNDNLIGMKCRAPLEESWGAINLHNAVIVCIEPGDSDEDQNGIKVRVMFTHPTYNKMKPCSYFLDGMCKFDEETCKFSHGNVVSYSDCLPYKEADLYKIGLGKKCLAKHTDGLWHPAIFSIVEEGATTVGIHFTDTKDDASLGLEDVYPLDIDSSSSEGSSSETEEQEGLEEDEDVVKIISTSNNTSIGQWEEHTSGIGSKLLQKMGYVYGKGLGKKGEGRVDPVEIIILPNGLSLDACIKLKETKKLRAVGEQPSKHRRRRKRKQQAKQKAETIREPKDETHFFNFLEKTLQSQEKCAVDVAKNVQATKSTGQNLNVELFEIHEQKRGVEKRIQSFKLALQRHRGRDKQMESHVQSKLQEAQRSLKQLQDKETRIQMKMSQNKNKQKLAIF